MAKKIRVLIVDDDLSALEMMTTLIRCDWRTQVVGKCTQMAVRPEQIQKTGPDLILYGGQNLEDANIFQSFLEITQRIVPKPKIVCTMTHATNAILHHFSDPNITGCLLKNEIGFSLVWALVLAARGKWVVTPGINRLANEIEFLFNQPPVIMNGNQPRVFTDGAIRPEKGLSGLAAIVRNDDGKICYWWCRRAGRLTCNQAEYEAIIMALEELRAYRPEQVAIYTDSRVVVEQMLGRASVKSVGLRAAHARLRALAVEYGGVHFFYIPRERNRLADALAYDVLDDWRE